MSADPVRLVCPNGCGREHTPMHASDEVGHICPKAKNKNSRLVWLSPAPPDSGENE